MSKKVLQSNLEERVARLEKQQFQLLGDMRKLVVAIEQFLRAAAAPKDVA